MRIDYTVTGDGNKPVLTLTPMDGDGNDLDRFLDHVDTLVDKVVRAGGVRKAGKARIKVDVVRAGGVRVLCLTATGTDPRYVEPEPEADSDADSEPEPKAK